MSLLVLHTHRTGVVPLQTGEGGEVAKGATPRVRKQLASKAFYLHPEPFCLSDKKQYTKQWFPTSSPPFPYRRAGRGRGSCEEPSLPGPPDPGSVESMFYAPCHVCTWLCTCCAVYVNFEGLGGRRFEAQSYPDITHCTTLTRIHTFVGSQFSQPQNGDIGLDSSRRWSSVSL